MDNLYIKIVNTAAEWFVISPDEMLEQPPLKDCVRKEPHTKGHMAFCLVCFHFSQNDMRDYKMTPIQIAKYFAVSEPHVLKAMMRHQHFLYSDSWYKNVQKRVVDAIDTHIKQVYESSEW
jgi:hypothetical protein